MAEADAQSRAVDEALKAWRQGDCVLGEQWFVVRAASGDLIETQVLGLCVVSQTCDLVRDSAQRSFVEVSPLVSVLPEILDQVRRGTRPQYGFLPSLAARGLVADLDRTMTVEKAVVAKWERTEGCSGDVQAREFALGLARKRLRFAFPNDFTPFVEPLRKRIVKKHNRDSEEGKALRDLREIRVQATPSWDAAAVSLVFYFFKKAVEKVDWDLLREQWTVVPSGRYVSVDMIVLTLDAVTAANYLASDPLELDHLSSTAER